MKDIYSPYCNNEDMEHAELLPCGLFSYEVLFLWYCSIRTIEVDKPYIKHENCYKFCYPELLFESLLGRGYIRIATNYELREYATKFKDKHLRELLKDRYEKLPRKRADKLKLLCSRSDDEIAEIVGKQYYTITEEAKEIVDNYSEIIENRWNNCFENFRSSLIENEKVTKAKIIYKQNDTFIKFKQSDIEFVCPKEYDFSRKIDLEIYFDNEHVGTYKCNRFSQFENNIALVIEKKRNKQFNCSIISESGIEYSETTNSIPSVMRYSLENVGEHLFSIRDEESIKKSISKRLYCSVKSPIVIEILRDERISSDVTALKNIVDMDYSTNVLISISNTNTCVHELLNYLYRIGLINAPKFFGVYIDDVVSMLRFYGDIKNGIIRNLVFSKLKERLKEPYINHFEEIKSFINEFPDSMSLINKFREYYPIMYLRNSFLDILTYADGDYASYRFTREREGIYKKLDKKYKLELKEIVQSAYLRKNIDSTWKSEISLFELFFKTYKDAVFQYRDSWLNAQSLDIYIPSFKTAVEYQGKQHYEPVEFFGGRDAFEKQQERDLRKKKLCADNGIRLLYWSYKVPVTTENFKQFLCDNGLV